MILIQIKDCTYEKFLTIINTINAKDSIYIYSSEYNPDRKLATMYFRNKEDIPEVLKPHIVDDPFHEKRIQELNDSLIEALNQFNKENVIPPPVPSAPPEPKEIKLEPPTNVQDAAIKSYEIPTDINPETKSIPIPPEIKEPEPEQPIPTSSGLEEIEQILEDLTPEEE